MPAGGDRHLVAVGLQDVAGDEVRLLAHAGEEEIEDLGGRAAGQGEVQGAGQIAGGCRRKLNRHQNGRAGDVDGPRGILRQGEAGAGNCGLAERPIGAGAVDDQQGHRAGGADGRRRRGDIGARSHRNQVRIDRGVVFEAEALGMNSGRQPQDQHEREQAGEATRMS